MHSILYELVLVVGIFLPSTIGTLAKKAQFDTTARGLHGNVHAFTKPWFQTWLMFMGELLCIAALIVTYIYQQRRLRNQQYKKQDIENASIVNSVDDKKVAHVAIQETSPLLGDDSYTTGVAATATATATETSQDGATTAEQHPAGTITMKVNPFLFLFPACCDLGATTLGSIGLLWTTASVSMMLRGSVVIFTTLLSMLFLKKRLKINEWIGIAIVIVGLTVVGLASLLSAPSVGRHGTLYALLGILLNVGGQFLNALQFVLEEKFIRTRNVHPLQVVGYEGFWGTMIMSFIVFPIIYFIPGKDMGSYENTLDTFVMLGHSGVLIALSLAYWISIAFLNFFSLEVTNKLSALHRTIITACSTVLVWVVDIILYYTVSKDYGEEWTKYSYIELTGFLLLLAGSMVHKGILWSSKLTSCRNKRKPKFEIVE